MEPLKQDYQALTIKTIIFLFALLSLSSCETLDTGLATSAALDAAAAFTINDEQIKSLSKQAAASQDQEHQLAPANNAYQIRLNRLVKQLNPSVTQGMNFQVYLKDEINAFALADGSIRFYSGLMDRLDDHELIFVIGHEIGHVDLGHSLKAAKVQYSATAIQKGLGAVGGTVGQLSQSELGSLLVAITNAQYSQYDERQADDYGFDVLRNHQLPTQAAITALRKLGHEGGGLLATHPNPQDRADRLEQR